MKTRHLLLGIPFVIASCESAQPPAGEDTPSAEKLPVPTGPQPSFGEVKQQGEPPPPISGGTLAIDRKSGLAVAADSDRDRVYIVDLPTRTVKHTVTLPHRSEPGRVALDASGRAHVALRQSGELATIHLATGAVATRPACTAPRGVAFDAKTDTIIVACATGDLLTFPSAAGTPSARASLGRDLRDVIVTAHAPPVLTRFRSAKIVTTKSEAALNPTANLAWRAVAAPPEAVGEGEDATAAVVTQDPTAAPVLPEPGGYGSGSVGDPTCGQVGIVSTRLWKMQIPAKSAPVSTGSIRLPSAVLPVDVATNGSEYVVVAAGNAFTPGLSQLFVVHSDQLATHQECGRVIEGNVTGQAISAAFDHKDELVVQTREPAALIIMTEDRRREWKTITLSTESRADTGHDVFHANAGGNIACASCHAEGADDGKTWEFVGQGPRRTPSLLGTTANTEPFHWIGDMKDLSTLVDHVFVERMGGPKIDKQQVDVLGHYLFTLPAPPKLRQLANVPPRGQELFNQRCSSCHSGSIMTNNQTVDVGTGGSFQVPSLVGLAWRAPFLHSGCATTLFDRFDPACGGAMHGDTKDLSRDQVADIVAYLETF